MGTLFRVVLYAPDAPSAERAAAAAFARIHQLDSMLSDYDPVSELSLLSARSRESAPTAPIPLGPELYEVLACAASVARDSNGAFDVTVGPFVDLWRRAVRQEELPSVERLAQARRAVGWEKLELDRGARTARLLARDMRLDLGGIAKGYACDEALEVLEREGCPRALVVGGGDVVLGDAPPDQGAWHVAIQPLEEGVGACTLELVHAAVSTSGDRYQFLETDGLRYSHIVDPSTGLGLTGRVAATVVAPDGASADALATALCVMGAQRGLELARRRGVEARILELESDGWRSCETTAWGRIMAPASASAETLVRRP